MTVEYKTSMAECVREAQDRTGASLEVLFQQLTQIPAEALRTWLEHGAPAESLCSLGVSISSEIYRELVAIGHWYTTLVYVPTNYLLVAGDLQRMLILDPSDQLRIVPYSWGTSR